MSSRDHHSSSSNSSSSKRYPPISGSSSRPSGSGRRASISSSSDRERGVFHMSDSDHSSSRASSHRSGRRPSMSGSSDIAGLARGIGNSLSLSDDRSRSSSSRHESSSSGSWEPMAARAGGPAPSRFFGGGGSSSSGSSSSARQPSSRHTGSGSGSGSGLFESRSGSHASASIPIGIGDRREIINSPSQFPGSGHSDHFKSRTKASTGQSYDSWKSDASVKNKYNSIKAGEDSWKGRAERYERGLDETPSQSPSSSRGSRRGMGESYEDINKNLSKSQHEKYGKLAHDTLSSISRTADRRVELNQDYSKEQLKKGLMTGHNTIRGHDTRVSMLEGHEGRYRDLAEKHYDYAGSSRRGEPSAELASARAARDSRTPKAQSGRERTVYEYGDRLRRDGRATEEQLRAAGWDGDNGRYSRDSRRRS